MTDTNVASLDAHRQAKSKEARLTHRLNVSEQHPCTPAYAAKLITDDLIALQAAKPGAKNYIVFLRHFPTITITDWEEFTADVETQLFLLNILNTTVCVHPSGSVIATMTIPA